MKAGWKLASSIGSEIYKTENHKILMNILIPRGGGSLIFSYIRRLGPFFGFKILNFNIFWGFQKNKYFWGYENLVDIFWGSSQNWTIFRGHFYAF